MDWRALSPFFELSLREYDMHYALVTWGKAFFSGIGFYSLPGP
jgi:hypothetical protein